MIAECRDMKLNVLPPDINRCEYAFVVLDDASILYGLGAIKGPDSRRSTRSWRCAVPMDRSAICSIFAGASTCGASIGEYCEFLIKAGALDGLGMQHARDTQSSVDATEQRMSRSTLMASLVGAGRCRAGWARSRGTPDDMFGMGGG